MITALTLLGLSIPFFWVLGTVFANIFPAVADDTAYCTGVTLPATEADLGPSVEVTSAAAVNAVSLTVGALNAALATGTVLTFPVSPGTTQPTLGGVVQATLTAAAAVGATTLTVAPIPGPIAANTYALYQGSPVSVPSGAQSLLAIVQFTVSGGPATNTSYVCLQTDLGDGVWVDVASILEATDTSNQTYTYTMATAFTTDVLGPQRANNTAPSSSGASGMPLGPRIRFTGKGVVSGGSSPKVLATIKYKFQGLR